MAECVLGNANGGNEPENVIGYVVLATRTTWDHWYVKGRKLITEEEARTVAKVLERVDKYPHRVAALVLLPEEA